MQILILNGSPNKSGNTSHLMQSFIEGARSAGNEIVYFQVGRMDIHACRACDACHKKNGNLCVFQDDMQQIYPYLMTADLVVFASPVHYWGFSGQLQSAITRFYAMTRPQAKKYALVLSSASEDVYSGIVSQYTSMVDYFGGEDVGMWAYNGDNQLTEEYLQEMYDFGASFQD